MRYFHKDIAPVMAHLEAQPCSIHILEWEREPLDGGFAFLPMMQKRRPAHPARAATASEVASFGTRKNDPRQAALVLRHYFHINTSAPEGRPLSLVEAVAHVESRALPGEFLLAGHPDGGLVSVSREPLPFQSGVSPITWWGP